jgi:hypothetical protein
MKPLHALTAGFAGGILIPNLHKALFVVHHLNKPIDGRDQIDI